MTGLVMILTPAEAAWYRWQQRGRLARLRDRLLRREAPQPPTWHWSRTWKRVTYNRSGAKP